MSEHLGDRLHGASSPVCSTNSCTATRQHPRQLTGRLSPFRLLSARLRMQNTSPVCSSYFIPLNAISVALKGYLKITQVFVLFKVANTNYISFISIYRLDLTETCRHLALFHFRFGAIRTNLNRVLSPKFQRSSGSFIRDRLERLYATAALRFNENPTVCVGFKGLGGLWRAGSPVLTPLHPPLHHSIHPPRSIQSLDRSHGGQGDPSSQSDLATLPSVQPC